MNAVAYVISGYRLNSSRVLLPPTSAYDTSQSRRPEFPLQTKVSSYLRACMGMLRMLMMPDSTFVFVRRLLRFCDSPRSLALISCQFCNQRLFVR